MAEEDPNLVIRRFDAYEDEEKDVGEKGKKRRIETDEANQTDETNQTDEANQ